MLYDELDHIIIDQAVVDWFIEDENHNIAYFSQ